MYRLFLGLIFIKKWKYYTQKSKNSLEKFGGSEKSSTFAPAFAQKHGFEALKKEFFERFT